MEKQTSKLNNGSTKSKVKLLCSYGGKIRPRPTDHQLYYIGGETKLLAIDRSAKFSQIMAKLMSLCNRTNNSDVSIKYQLPGEDLDALVSLIDDDDVEHMMVEYDRMQMISAKPSRIRLFVFDISIPTAKSSNPDYLFGFDKEYQPSLGPPLDLLQIPGMVLPENYGIGNGNQAIYRIPVVASGGVGRLDYEVTKQPLHNFVPVQEMKVNQRIS